ncbi:MAG: hypothetical protein KAG19_03385 [Methylococcales bacterium]|nr:hypothetical protein [Methylococcales bacterium]
MSDFTQQELNELNVELNELDADFSEFNSVFDGQLLPAVADSSEELDALGVALEGSDIEETDLTTSSQLSLLDLMDGDFSAQSLDMQGWGWPWDWPRRKCSKIIRKIVGLVRKYSKLKACVPAVTKAVALFKAKKYVSALRAAYSAYKCIKRKL